MKLDDEIKKVFSSPTNREYGDKYLEEVQRNIRDCWTGIAKGFLGIVLAVAFHELLARAAIAKVSVTGFELKDLGIVRSFLPAVIAYYAYHVSALYASELRVSTVHDSALRALYPEISASRLAEALEPISAPIAGAGRGKTSTAFGMVLVVSVFFGAPIYVVYAYILQLMKFPINAPVVIGMVASAFFSAYAIAIAVEAVTSKDLD